MAVSGVASTLREWEESALNVRIRYEQLGEMQFLSHLELMKTLEQIFRKNRVPMIYSQGFNPKPQMTFALPLAVGIQSAVDYLDILIEEDFDLDQFYSIPLPQGLRITGVKVVDDKPLMAEVHSALFMIEGDLDALKEGLEGDLQFMKRTKKGMRTRDARQYLLEYEFNPTHLLVHLKAGSVENLKPTDLLLAILKDEARVYAYEITRLAIFDKEGQSLWER